MRDHLRVVASGERMATRERDAELARVVDRARDDRVHRALLVAPDLERLLLAERVGEGHGPSHGVGPQPGPAGQIEVRPAREREQVSHRIQTERTAISTSPWTTVIAYSVPAVRSRTPSRKASCSKARSTGSVERGTSA